ncbi:phosphotransferase enzyme family protein [Paucisalibacillus globulus]|uniref:phosphotransferase enzyme family protein n=1 Tax=Paucisalibacillus globulus TaxID=351095 RepID=UPI001596EBE5|nr:phosphotransferase [Paucisalibacillus globulus]
MDKGTLSEGAQRFDADGPELRLLGGFSSNVFEGKRNGENFVLKFYPSTVYKKEAIIAELDWVRFLHSSGVKLTPPLRSTNGKYLETITVDGEKECYVLAFEKAKGSFIDLKDTETWNRDFYHSWGKTLGKIHRLSKHYIPSDEVIQRQDWNMGLLFSEDLCGVNKAVVQKWEEYVAELSKLPKDKNGYGMIHHDLHQRNFYVHHNEIILFDFGDCEYNWFIYDIAIVLYHAVQSIDEYDSKEREKFAYLFMKAFLEGYLTENNLESYWYTKLQFFLNYRRIFSYLFFSKYLTKEQKDNKRVVEKLNVMKSDIVRDIPFLDMNYNDLLRDREQI